MNEEQKKFLIKSNKDMERVVLFEGKTSMGGRDGAVEGGNPEGGCSYDREDEGMTAAFR